ncbi:MAG: PCRF domain-containing protein, partial [Bdellovibrionota bacterium]
MDELSELSTTDGFWNDNKRARALTQEKSRLESEVKEFQDLERAYQDVETLVVLSQELKDADTLVEAGALVPGLRDQVEKVEFHKMLSEPQDVRNAIVTINAGA